MNTMKSINARVRALLEAQEQTYPGSRHRAERVAVYAVATGERLRMNVDQLLPLRLAAELRGIASVDDDLFGMTAKDDQSLSIIRLAAEFDSRRSGFQGHPQLSDAECEDWLISSATKEFDQSIVEAMLAVQKVIQPIGT